MEARSVMGPNVICYNVDTITLMSGSIVSQYAYLCTASHDHESADFHLITAPIVIETGAWVAADAFVAMGVRIGEGAVVGARAAVFHDVERYTIVGGNPACVLKRRGIPNETASQLGCAKGVLDLNTMPLAMTKNE
jgi:putative colanic acid biosynthesis acetyltransferase WcaF